MLIDEVVVTDQLNEVKEALKELRDTFNRFDDKWEAEIRSNAEDRALLRQVASQVEHVDKLLTRGNGQKSVLAQLENMHTEINNLKEISRTFVVSTNNDANFAELHLKNLGETKKARWIAIGKILGLISLALPGILALFGLAG